MTGSVTPASTTDTPMNDITFWGVTASPYLLKMQSLADQARLNWQRWPDQASRWQAVNTAVRLGIAKRRGSVERYPQMVAGMDEYPAVPFYTFDEKAFYYDSSALAGHLDKQFPSANPLVPEQPQLRFVCQLIDEAFDEFGLYMVHHNRWITSTATNVMGEVTARELRNILPPGLQGTMAKRLARRQVGRCPYLFSVAPKGFDAGVAADITAPSRTGFPATHAILDDAWRNYLRAMESLLQTQPYLLGQRFTLADAAAYGQLSMNLTDGRAAQLLRQLAPTTFDWLCRIRDGKHRGSSGPLQLSDALAPLLLAISQTFIPLMQKNEVAYVQASNAGQRLFNEAAFVRGEALYDGELQGKPFRSVAKSFQVVVWRELRSAWQALGDEDQQTIQRRFPCLAPSPFD
jgi:glutathione S-transferase